MKKKTAILLIALILIAIVIVNIFVLRAFFHKQTDQIYAKITIVQTVDTEHDTVVVKDANSNTWTFSGVEGWNINDVCSCLMDSKGTTSVYDDEIISTRHDGMIVGWIIK